MSPPPLSDDGSTPGPQILRSTYSHKKQFIQRQYTLESSTDRGHKRSYAQGREVLVEGQIEGKELATLRHSHEITANSVRASIFSQEKPKSQGRSSLMKELNLIN